MAVACLMMYGPAKRKSPHKSGSYGRTSFAIWGSGKAKGEFLCVDYMAVASAHVMNLDKLTYDQQGLSMLGHSKKSPSANSWKQSATSSATQAQSLSIPANPMLPA